MQEETIFHEALTECSVAQLSDGCEVVGCRDIQSQHALADGMARAAHTMYLSTDELNRREMHMAFINQSNSKLSSHSQILSKRSASFRAERDLWSLIGVLTSADLMRDIPNTDVEKFNLNLSPFSSVKEVISEAYALSESIRKGKILKDWIERAAIDKVTEYSAASNPTKKLSGLPRISNNLGSSNQKMDSMHPDAQLKLTSAMLTHDSSYIMEQEQLLKSVWQLIRSGDIIRAQEVAVEHGMFYLAASLLGIAHENNTLVENISDDHEFESETIGNGKRNVWLETCYKYADYLAGSRVNWIQQKAVSLQGEDGELTCSSIAMLEMTIYAALSNNTNVLSTSSLMTSWTDRLWMYLKATHEREIAIVLQRHNQLKNTHSKLFNFSDDHAVKFENDYIHQLQMKLNGFNTGDCVGIFESLPVDVDEYVCGMCDTECRSTMFGSPASIVSKNEPTLKLLYRLQSSVIQGYSALKEYINAILLPLVVSRQVSRYMSRVFAHLIIWLYLSCAHQTHLRDLIDDKLLNETVGMYIENLMTDGQIEMVATYASFLDRTTRIQKYIKWLNSLPVHLTHNLTGSGRKQEGDSVYILASAKQFFRDDILDITRGTVEIARSSDLIGLSKSVITTLTALDTTPHKIRQHTMSPASVRTPSALTSSTPHNNFTGIELSATVASPDDADQLRIDSLRWLSIDMDHRGEVVHQINQFIVKFLLESGGGKTQLVHKLLKSPYLPKDAIEVGSRNLEVRHASERDQDSRILEDVQSPEYLRREDIRVAELRAWKVEVDKLRSWQALDSAIQNVDGWMKVRDDLLRTRRVLLGDSAIIRSSTASKCATLERNAEIATKDLLRALRCIELSVRGNEVQFASGIFSIWATSEDALLESLEELLSCDMATMREVQGSEHDYEQLIQYYEKFRASNWIHGENSPITRIITACKDLDKDATYVKPMHGYGLSIKANEILRVLIEEKQTLSLVVDMICTKYLTVCLDTANILRDIHLPQAQGNVSSSSTEQATGNIAQWLQAAVRLADIIAEEEMSLYVALDADQIYRILDMVNVGVVGVLALTSDFL